MTAKNAKYFIELILIFIGLPILFLFDFIPGLLKGIPLLALFLYCLLVLYKSKEFDRVDWKFQNIKVVDYLKLLVFPLFLFSTLFVFFPEMVTADFQNSKVVVAIICYPLFSSLPQEIIYRKFFYTRYSGLFGNKVLIVLINGLLFFLCSHIFPKLYSTNIDFYRRDCVFIDIP